MSQAAHFPHAPRYFGSYPRAAPPPPPFSRTFWLVEHFKRPPLRLHAALRRGTRPDQAESVDENVSNSFFFRERKKTFFREKFFASPFFVFRFSRKMRKMCNTSLHIHFQGIHKNRLRFSLFWMKIG